MHNEIHCKCITTRQTLFPHVEKRLGTRLRVLWGVKNKSAMRSVPDPLYMSWDWYIHVATQTKLLTLQWNLL